MQYAPERYAAYQNIFSASYGKNSRSDFRVKVEINPDKNAYENTLFRIETNGDKTPICKSFVNYDNITTVTDGLVFEDKNNPSIFMDNPILFEAYLRNSWGYPITKIGSCLVAYRENIQLDVQGRPLIEILYVIEASGKPTRKIINRYIHGFNGSYIIISEMLSRGHYPGWIKATFVQFNKSESQKYRQVISVKNIEGGSKYRVKSFEIPKGEISIYPNLQGRILNFDYDDNDNIVAIYTEVGHLQINKFHESGLEVTFKDGMEDPLFFKFKKHEIKKELDDIFDLVTPDFNYSPSDRVEFSIGLKKLADRYSDIAYQGLRGIKYEIPQLKPFHMDDVLYSLL